MICAPLVALFVFFGCLERESCTRSRAVFDARRGIRLPSDDRTRDTRHFRQVLGDKMNKLPGILQTNSFAVMEVLK